MGVLVVEMAGVMAHHKVSVNFLEDSMEVQLAPLMIREVLPVQKRKWEVRKRLMVSPDQLSVVMWYVQYFQE